MTARQLKPKLCRVCKGEFVPINSTQVVCHWKCAAEYVDKRRKVSELSAQRKQERELKRKNREQKEAVRPLRWYANKAREACHDYVRLRDKNADCISCGRAHDGQYHAGHYRPSGINSALRYDESNIHKQCAPCNSHLSGNLTNYRIGLIAKIGEAAVVALEEDRQVRKWTREELIAIRKHYQNKLKELRDA